MKEKNGVSMIMLVIIIIVIILASVVFYLSTKTISAPSGDGTTTASKDELSIGDYENYVPSTSTDSNTLTTADNEDGETTTASNDELSIGDYVNYIPSTSTTSKILTTAETGYSSSQTISQETLSWQILEIGTDGTVKLISTPTSGKVYLYGADGYNGGVKALNDVCEALYSNTAKGITARSVNYEDDFEPYLTTEGKSMRDAHRSTVTYGNTYTYTSSNPYPNIYAQEKGAGINTTTVNTTGLAGNESPETAVTGSTTASTSITCTETYWSGSMGNFGEQGAVLNNTTDSWLASRCVRCNSNCAQFFLRHAGSGLSASAPFYSSGFMFSRSYGVRAVVTLGPSVNITPCTGTNSASNAHTIAW